MPRFNEPDLLTVRESFEQLNVDDLKPLAALIGSPPNRKAELVDFLGRNLESREQAQKLYEGLDEIGQKAVQEATHDPDGMLHGQQFRAKYGRSPDFGGSGRRYDGNKKPTTLRLFLPLHRAPPYDLRKTLLAFVPEPPPLTVDACDELPSQCKPPHVDLGPYHSQPDEEEVEPRVRRTARPALHDVKAVLRLIDAGDVRVSDKTRRPSQAAMTAVAGILAEGEFYTDDDRSDDKWDQGANDLQMQAFAWPLLLQAAGLAEAAGTRLQLTAAGRKATTKPAHEVVRQVWSKWLTSTLLDEFNRINVIKGQQAKGRGLTAIAPRRYAVVEVLEECPVRKWIVVEELFRLLKALTNFHVTHDSWKLYIGEQQYGSLGYDAEYTWETLQGRFVLAFLFEYMATLGLLDVAYIAPSFARNDFRGRWGTDDISCLSRYDGLLFIRINSLGAWCLGLADEYTPEAIQAERNLKVLPNLDVVAAGRQPSPADVLFLDRFAERTSEAVWRLSREKALAALEHGLDISELKEFLTTKSDEPLPGTVDVFLNDLREKVGQLEDQGTARLIQARDAVIAKTIANDRRLRGLCQLAGERQLIFKAADEAVVRRALRELGYFLPPIK